MIFLCRTAWRPCVAVRATLLLLGLCLAGLGLQAFPAMAAGVLLWDVAKSAERTPAQAVAAMPPGAMVLVGEQHDVEAHHQVQREIIAAIKMSGRPTAVGLEMFERRNQQILDAWVAGTLTEESMAMAFAENWDGRLWPQYRPIFAYCRQQKIPMVGLNVPREITRQVARQGFGSLSAEQRGTLPLVACVIDPEYEDALRGLLGPHGMDQNTFTRFCEAQLVWDTAMAHNALEYLKTNPGATIAVLAGQVHAWRKAIPAQVRRFSDSVVPVSIMPATQGGLTRETVRPADADYLVISPSAGR